MSQFREVSWSYSYSFFSLAYSRSGFSNIYFKIIMMFGFWGDLIDSKPSDYIDLVHENSNLITKLKQIIILKLNKQVKENIQFFLLELENLKKKICFSLKIQHSHFENIVFIFPEEFQKFLETSFRLLLNDIESMWLFNRMSQNNRMNSYQLSPLSSSPSSHPSSSPLEKILVCDCFQSNHYNNMFE